MKLILKEKQVYDKINIVKDLLIYIQYHYDLDITFDNRQTNHYKLIVFEQSFSFSTYNDVINCLKFIIACADNK